MTEFMFVPLWSWQQSMGYRVLTTEMESGREYRYYKNRRPREWTLGFRDTAENIEELECFFRNRKGPYETFLWVPPGETRAVCVRFKEATLDITGSGKSLKECQVVLREVIQ